MVLINENNNDKNDEQISKATSDRFAHRSSMQMIAFDLQNVKSLKTNNNDYRNMFLASTVHTDRTSFYPTNHGGSQEHISHSATNVLHLTSNLSI